MGAIRRGLCGTGLVMASLACAVPAARADVVTSSETGFVVRIASEVTAPPADAWKLLLTPAQWWQSQHTFSGDAANLSLDPQVGGCFCEVLPRPEGAPATQKPGGVQHMRIVYFEPPRAVRLVGSLGPLQSEALSATLTITIKPTETAAGKGSRILFEYVVGGFMRYKVDDIAPAVDRMLTAQLTSLAGKLGPVAEPVTAPAVPRSGAVMGPPAAPDERPAAEAEPKPVAPLSGAESYSLPPAGSKPAAKSAPKSGTTSPAAPSSAPQAVQAAAQPAAKPATKPAAAVTPPPPVPAGKAPIKAAYLPPAKPAAKDAAKPAVQAVARPPAKAPARSAATPAARSVAKAPDPEAEAHRDANAAFDAALSGTAPTP